VVTANLFFYDIFRLIVPSYRHLLYYRVFPIVELMTAKKKMVTWTKLIMKNGTLLMWQNVSLQIALALHIIYVCMLWLPCL
jgi:hypothetical protein